MPYEFPKHVTKSQEILDPDKLTLELSPATEQLSGQVNSSNFNGPSTEINRGMLNHSAILDLVQMSATAGSDFRYNGVGNGAGDPVAAPYYGYTALVESSHWNTVLVSNTRLISRPTRLWVSGIGQYHWSGWTNLQRPPFPGHFFQYGDMSDDTPPSQYKSGLDDYPRRLYGARIQWAIRVNGMIIEDSITGAHDENQEAIVPIHTKVDRLLGADQFPGPSGEKTPQRSALGVVAWPSRVGCVVDVPVGNMTIELVCRKLEDSRFIKRFGQGLKDNTVVLHNCTLNAFIIPTRVGSQPAHSSVEVPAFGDQEQLSFSSLYSSRMMKLEQTLNLLEVGNLAAGTFRPEHMKQGAVVSSGTISLHAKSDLGYTGFIYRNRRPDRQFSKVASGEATTHPDKMRIIYDTTKPSVSGWAMWGVKNFNNQFLNRIDALLTDHDDSLLPTVTGTDNVSRNLLIGSTVDYWTDPNHAWALLHQDFNFKKGRRQALVINADVQLLCAIGDTTASVWSADAQKGAYVNSGVFSFFRIGFHKKGDHPDDWVMPTKSEVFVNQFCNWRRHPLTASDSDGGAFKDVRPMPTQGNVSLQLVMRRPWLQEQGGALAANRVDSPAYQWSDDYEIDAIALFVAGGENMTTRGPQIGLSGANLSALMIDLGKDLT